jgi:peptidoglycan/LPS O-acetylase OafA/YrhL
LAVIDDSPASPPQELDPGEGAVAAGTYRPHLDGLRAVAVYLVVLFHAGSSGFTGGYVGVDVFFVLSGFLVTQLLVRDIAGRGSIRLGRFYARRFRRLLPAAFVALIVTAIVFSAIASPLEITNAVGSFKAAFLYSTNWYFIHTATGYFGANLATNPVLQFWSLAVEEQFYLIWPLLLGGAFFWTRRMNPTRQMRVIRIGITIAAIASAVWALSLRNTNPDRAYYGTDTRAYELLAGALLALIPAFIANAARYRKTMRTATVAGVAALILIASSLVHIDAIERGIAVTLITCVILIAIEAANGGLTKRFLSTAPVVYLGKISYGTYLWHWLVILFITKQLHLSIISTITITCVVATALASLSYEILERPIRISPLLDRHRRIVITTGLAISIISALILIPKIANPAQAAEPIIKGSTTTGFTPIPPGLDTKDAQKGFQLHSCEGQPAADCTVVHGTGQSIMLIGDSHAGMFIPTFTEIAKRDHLTLSVSASALCPWQRNLYAPAGNLIELGKSGVKGVSIQDCKAIRDDLYTRVIPALHPDIIVAVDLDGAYADPQVPTAQSLQQLTQDGRKVILVEDPPAATIDTLGCLSQAKVLQQCRFIADTTPTPLELLYRKLDAESSDVFSANFDQIVCPYLPICDPVIGGNIVRFDATHLTADFAKYIAPQVDAYLKQTVLKSTP